MMMSREHATVRREGGLGGIGYINKLLCSGGNGVSVQQGGNPINVPKGHRHTLVEGDIIIFPPQAGEKPLSYEVRYEDNCGLRKDHVRFHISVLNDEGPAADGPQARKYSTGVGLLNHAFVDVHTNDMLSDVRHDVEAYLTDPSSDALGLCDGGLVEGSFTFKFVRVNSLNAGRSPIPPKSENKLTAVSVFSSHHCCIVVSESPDARSLKRSHSELSTKEEALKHAVHLFQPPSVEFKKPKLPQLPGHKAGKESASAVKAKKASSRTATAPSAKSGKGAASKGKPAKAAKKKLSAEEKADKVKDKDWLRPDGEAKRTTEFIIFRKEYEGGIEEHKRKLKAKPANKGLDAQELIKLGAKLTSERWESIKKTCPTDGTGEITSHGCGNPHTCPRIKITMTTDAKNSEMQLHAIRRQDEKANQAGSESAPGFEDDDVVDLCCTTSDNEVPSGDAWLSCDRSPGVGSGFGVPAGEVPPPLRALSPQSQSQPDAGVLDDLMADMSQETAEEGFGN